MLTEGLTLLRMKNETSHAIPILPLRYKPQSHTICPPIPSLTIAHQGAQCLGELPLIWWKLVLRFLAHRESSPGTWRVSPETSVWWYQICTSTNSSSLSTTSKHVITRHNNTIMTWNLSKVAASGPFCNGSVWIPCSILEALRKQLNPSSAPTKAQMRYFLTWNDLHVQNIWRACIMDVLHVWRAKSGTAHLLDGRLAATCPLWQLGSSRWILHFWHVWPQHSFNTVDGRNPSPLNRCDVSNLVNNGIFCYLSKWLAWNVFHQPYVIHEDPAASDFPSPRAGTSVPIPRLLAPGLGLGSISGMPLMLVDAKKMFSLLIPDQHLGGSVAWHPATKRNSSYTIKKKRPSK